MSYDSQSSFDSLRPFLKWAGGKRQLIPQIMEKMPLQMETYFEAFIGGGAVFFELARQQRFQKAVISDQNLELVTTYRALRDDVESVIKALSSLKYSEEEFYRLRATKPRTPHRIAARMIYLNRTGFNGLYRVNRSGQFNVPFGHYKKPRICDADGLRTVSQALQNVEILHADFEQTVSSASERDVVYFDPPYLPVSKTASFAQYHKLPFGPDEHLRLAEVYRQLQSKGVLALLSNSDTPATRKIFGEFKHEFVAARRNINSKGSKRGPIQELLVIGELASSSRVQQGPGLVRASRSLNRKVARVQSKAG